MLGGSWSDMTGVNKCANKALMVYWVIMGSDTGPANRIPGQLLLNPLTLKVDR